MSSTAVKKGLAGVVALGLAFTPAMMASKPAQASVSSSRNGIILSPQLGRGYMKAHFDFPTMNPHYNPKRIIEQPVPGSEMAAAAISIGRGQGIRPMGCRM